MIRKILSLSIMLATSSAFAETELSVIDVDNNPKDKETVDYSSLDISVLDLNIDEDLLKEDEKIKELRAVIKRVDYNYKDATIKKLDELDGFYEVIHGKKVLYISEDGKYIVPTIAKVVGNGFEDIQKERKRKRVQKFLETEVMENTEHLVTYPATSEKRMSVYVFSDFTCPWCRRLHDNMVYINSMGIEVNYIPYPKNGIRDKNALVGLQKIMCSDNKQEEYDKAFLNPRSYSINGEGANPNCLKGKTALHKALTWGDEINLNATPYILSEQGQLLGGFRDFETFQIIAEKEIIEKEKREWDLE